MLTKMSDELVEVVECMRAWDKDPNVRPHDVLIENSAALQWCISTLERIAKDLLNAKLCNCVHDDGLGEEHTTPPKMEKVITDMGHTLIKFGWK